MNDSTSTTDTVTPRSAGSGDPDDAELKERARRAREAWLAGPTEEEMVAWARRERMRRLADAGLLPENRSGGDDLDLERMVRRYGREAQLAVEGAIYLAFTGPLRLYSQLVETGREFEGGATRVGPRRRVPMYDE